MRSRCRSVRAKFIFRRPLPIFRVVRCSSIYCFQTRTTVGLFHCTQAVLPKYKAICFIDGIKLDERFGVACVIYEDLAEKATFQYRLRDEYSVFKAERFSNYLGAKL